MKREEDTDDFLEIMIEGELDADSWFWREDRWDSDSAMVWLKREEDVFDFISIDAGSESEVIDGFEESDDADGRFWKDDSFDCDMIEDVDAWFTKDGG